MPVSVSKRRPKITNKTEPKKTEKSLKDPRTCSNKISWIFSRSFIYLVPVTILLSFLAYLWSISTTIISNDVVHICISSRKLNDIYCLAAGSHSGLRVPAVNNFTKPFSEDVIRSEEEKSHVAVLGKDGDKNFAKNETFTGERVLDNTTVTESLSFFNKSHVQEEKNLESILDQDSELKSETDLDIFQPKDEGEENAQKAAGRCIQIQRSWLSMGNKRENPGSCKGNGVYVYELPSKFNKDMLGECSNFCSFFKNDAFGESIENLGKDWFKTQQFFLEPIFHARVLKHPCRVYDESQAKLFYVPFYGGIDFMRLQFTNVSKEVNDVLAIEVVKWLQSKKSWRRNVGKDHVFVFGKISWDFRRKNESSWGSSLLEMQEMKNPTKVLIERNPWDVNDVAIPYPTYFHPKTDDDISNWQNKIIRKPRRSLISFAGGARPGIPNSIRSTLIDQCTSSPAHCRFLNCTDGGCDKPESVMELFQDSEFCLQPSGDSPTRRSVFDSFVSGCIPVIFDPYTAYYQYSWHLPKDYRTYSVYINEEDLRTKKVNLIEKLMSKTPKEREDMRSYIVHELLPGLVYGDSNAKFERFRDAFDITMDSLLHKISNNL